MTLSTAAPSVSHADSAAKKKTLIAACTAHATHDGLSDLVYVLLPVWQEMFMLSYVWLSVLRSAYSLTLAVLQIPASSLSSRMKPAYVLSIATAMTGIGWLAAGFTGSALALGAALVFAGMGASAQHPIASAMVSRAYAGNAKRPLGVYNFAGDIGKSLLPACAAFLLTFTTFHITATVFAGIGLLSAVLIWALLKDVTPRGEAAQALPSRTVHTAVEAGQGAFRVLLCTAVMDSAVRMGFLTFLPFIIKGNGGSLPQAGLALTLVFIGGAVGKFVCGWMSEHFGTLNTIVVTELATALLIGVVLVSPLPVGLAALPLLGAVLNGTSSVLYGAVTDVVDSTRLEKAFSVFYTGTIGSGALAPVLYGFVGDHAGVISAAVVVAATAVLSVLPVWLYSLRHTGTFRD
ncbi:MULTISPECIES: MFS transporter [unclassified Pseudomonas]|uniref:MFS transporter n=1 Tax=unclassified Pseudomonas TaxID=196821 RepID=UPI0025DF9994|nr:MULTISPECIES: MFS transporter [unclassified Pseudomonas]